MKSLKQKLIAVMLTMITVSTVLTVSVAIFQSFNVTEKSAEILIEQQLTASNNMLEEFLNERFGSINLNDEGQLADEKGVPIRGKYECIDEFSDEMNVVATVFVKENNDFVRLLTTVKDANGERAIGTNLDASSPAYQAVSKGQEYSGEADILNVRYMTGYKPIYDANNNIIGIYFVGIPVENVNKIIESGMISIIRNVVIIGALILLAAGIATLIISKGIVKPIKTVTEAADRIAAGNFELELSIDSKDEVGQLARSFNLTIERLVSYQEYIDEISEALLLISDGDLTFFLQKEYEGQFEKLKVNMKKLLESLNNIIHKISDAAYQVDSSAGTVSGGAQTLSQGAVEQASSIEELSASISEVSQKISETASNAKTAHDKSSFAERELNNSNVQMTNMVAAMNDITEKSSEISKIIKIIEDIAFQTNILALNAAVEAARAGDAGKGFAVVADEVRNLAGKSAEAAQNTTALIEETVEAVQNGAGIAEKTAEALESSHKVTLEAVKLIEEIAQNSQEQSNAISQINLGIEQISSIVQDNAATSEESAAASEELSNQANVLKELISEFKLRS